MIILYLIGAYLATGIIFSIPFLVKWIDQVDETARGAGWLFKLTILPGCIVFWPTLLKKYIDAKNGEIL